MTILLYLSLMLSQSNPWIPKPPQTCYILADEDGTMYEICPAPSPDPIPEPMPLP